MTTETSRRIYWTMVSVDIFARAVSSVGCVARRHSQPVGLSMGAATGARSSMQTEAKVSTDTIVQWIRFHACSLMAFAPHRARIASR